MDFIQSLARNAELEKTRMMSKVVENPESYPIHRARLDYLLHIISLVYGIPKKSIKNHIQPHSVFNREMHSEARHMYVYMYKDITGLSDAVVAKQLNMLFKIETFSYSTIFKMRTRVFDWTKKANMVSDKEKERTKRMNFIKELIQNF